jgi:hypothetical protein
MQPQTAGVTLNTALTLRLKDTSPYEKYVALTGSLRNPCIGRLPRFCGWYQRFGPWQRRAATSSSRRDDHSDNDDEHYRHHHDDRGRNPLDPGSCRLLSIPRSPVSLETGERDG